MQEHKAVKFEHECLAQRKKYITLGLYKTYIEISQKSLLKDTSWIGRRCNFTCQQTSIIIITLEVLAVEYAIIVLLITSYAALRITDSL